jgi:membrane protein implicated in regulation of membrane protease activity
MDAVFLDWVARLQEWNAPWYLLVAGVLLILIDYYFRTDAPAHFAYFAFGLVVFFVANLPLVLSIVAGLATWLVLAILHRTVLYKYLHNTEPDRGPEGGSEGVVPTQPPG